MLRQLRPSLIAVALGVFAYLMRNDPGVLGIGAVASIISGCVSGKFPDHCDASFPGRMPFLATSMWADRFTSTAQDEASKYAPGATALSGKTVIITGATDGIGAETAKVLLNHGAHVVFAARNTAKADKLIASLPPHSGTATVLHLELGDTKSVETFAKSFLDLNIPLHILVNNGGIMIQGQEQQVSKQGHELSFAVNHLAHFQLTSLLETKLLASGTVADPARVLYLTTSGVELWNGPDADGTLKKQVPPVLDEARYHAFFAYCRSKVLNVLTALHQQRKWGPNAKAISMAVHPGLIPTGILDNGGDIKGAFYSWPFIHAQKSIGQGAATTIHCALAPQVVNETRSGVFYYVNSAADEPGKIGGHKEWFSDALAKESWDRTAALL